MHVYYRGLENPEFRDRLAACHPAIRDPDTLLAALEDELQGPSPTPMIVPVNEDNQFEARGLNQLTEPEINQDQRGYMQDNTEHNEINQPTMLKTTATETLYFMTPQYEALRR